MYIIVGCSWGAGEYGLDHDTTHGGLCQYIRESGRGAINLSVGGSSNYSSMLRLDLFFNSHVNRYLKHPLGPKDKIFFFQTEWHRDYRYDNPGVQQQPPLPKDPANIDTWTICNLYYRLSELVQENGVPIYLIGGCADTIWLDEFEQEYPGLQIACQSMTNLCINDEHRVATPFLGGMSPSMADTMRQHFDKSKSISQILDMINQSQMRYQTWEQHKKWFWPDGAHANRHAHLKLFNWLGETGLID